MNQRRIGILAALVSIFGVVIQYVPSLIINRWVANGPRFPDIVPTFGTIGTTVTIYSQLVNIVGPSVTAFLAITLGYYAGQRLDVVRKYRRFIGTVAIGSSFPLLVGIGLSILGGFASLSVSLESVLLTLGVFLSMFVAVPLVVVLGAFAGLTFAHLQHAGDLPRPPVETDTDTSSKNSQEPGINTGDEQTQPAD